MDFYDRLFAEKTNAGLPVMTITGVPPFRFKSDGSPLSAWTIYGNSQQDGTMTEFVGVRTDNLLPLTIQTQTINGVKFTINIAAGTVTLDGSLTSDISTALSIPIPPTLAGDYYMSGCPSGGSYSTYDAFIWDATAGARPKKWDGTTGSESDFGGGNVEIKLVSGHSNFYRIRPRYGVQYSGDIVFRPMIRVPSAPPDFDPYGYKLTIKCEEKTTTIYIGDPLRKAIDGSDAVDILSSTGTITRAVDADGNALTTPTTQIIDVPPEIQTVRGSNTLTVDTTVQPSSASITGHIKAIT